MKLKRRKHVRLYPETRSDTGKESYVVDFRTAPGKRVRRRFSSAEEAEAEAKHIETLLAHRMSALAAIPLEELAAFNAVFQQLPNVTPQDLVTCYFHLHGTNGLAPEGVAVATAAEEFQITRSQSSPRHIETLRAHFGRFVPRFGERLLQSITREELQDYIDRIVGGAAKTRHNHSTTLKTFGKWAREKKRWLPSAVRSAFEEIELPLLRPQEKSVYPPHEMMRLLAATPRDMLAFLVLGGFGGIRAAERVRLKPEHWQADNKLIELPASVTKTQRRRIVDDIPNLAKWMEVVKTDGEFLVGRRTPRNATRQIAQAAGVPWKKNALRYSFASYHIQLFRNPSRTAMLDGHSVDELERTYKSIRGVNDRSAKEWFKITPRRVRAFVRLHKLPMPEWAEKKI